jgi:ComF family protein
MPVWSSAADKLKGFFGGVSLSLYPDACVGCEELLEKHEEIFCTRCERDYIAALERECGRCFRPRSRCICSKKALEDVKISRLVKLYNYRGRSVNLPQNRLIFALKHHHRTDVRQFLALELAEAVKSGIPGYEHFVLAYAPRGRKSVIKDGYDHILELTEEMAKLLRIPKIDAIGRHAGGKIQKKLSYLERQKNMMGRFYLRDTVDIAGKSILLVDDIVTSGATLIESARVLYGGGAKEVVGVVVAATGRDELRKPRRFSVRFKTMK